MKSALLSLGTLLLPLVASSPILDVSIHVTGENHVQTQHAIDLGSVTALKEQIPGWIFVEGDVFRARIHGNTFWNVKGKLDERFPLEDFLWDPLIFSLDHPEDFGGKFNGTIGRGEISLTWEKSGATIKGRSPVGDFQIAGTSKVDYSP